MRQVGCTRPCMPNANPGVPKARKKFAPVLGGILNFVSVGIQITPKKNEVPYEVGPERPTLVCASVMPKGQRPPARRTYVRRGQAEIITHHHTFASVNNLSHEADRDTLHNGYITGYITILRKGLRGQQRGQRQHGNWATKWGGNGGKGVGKGRSRCQGTSGRLDAHVGSVAYGSRA